MKNTSTKPISEIADNARKEFYIANGYYPTEEQILTLVKEAKEKNRVKTKI